MGFWEKLFHSSDGDWAPDWMDITPNKKNGGAKFIASLPVEGFGALAQGVGGLIGDNIVGKAFTGIGNAMDNYGDYIREDGIIGGLGGLAEQGYNDLNDAIKDAYPEQEATQESNAPDPVERQTNAPGARRRGTSIKMSGGSELAPWLLPTTTSRGFFNRFRR